MSCELRLFLDSQLFFNYTMNLSNENVNFNSELDSQVYNALTALGYEVHTLIGIGGYSIDLAIKKKENSVIKNVVVV